MKFYMLITSIKNSVTGDFSISWHRRLCFSQEEAFKEAKKMGEDTCVIELIESNTWNFNQMKEEVENV